jgi:isopenicillin N synthase-like dioxygenase
MEIRVIDLDNYTQNTITSALYESGIFCVKVTKEFQQFNECFIDLLEKYSDLPSEIKANHIRKDLHYQIGLTPENTETPMNHCEKVYRMGGNKPSGKDPKQRWFHRTTPLVHTEIGGDLTGENIIPDEFPEWAELFNKMGDLFSGVLERVNIILGEELDYPLIKLCENGNHLIAPTISDLEIYHKLNDILGGFHNDISFLTLHGTSRFPALNIWNRDNIKIRAKVPKDCVLIQAGRQLEYITNGYIMAGFHEVVVENDTIDAYYNAKEKNRSTTRISSTFFAHIASNNVMEVLPQFQTHDYLLHHPPIKESEWIRKELESTLGL